MPRTCEVCGSEFLVEPFRVKQRAVRYCSATCRGVGSKGRPSPLKGTGHTVVMPCEQCGAEFRPHAPNAAKPQRFCSFECKSAAENVPVIIPDDERDLIYFAGLIDGEGTITVRMTTSPSTGNESMHCRLMMANTYEPVMQWVAKTFGGYLTAPRAVRPGIHKPVQNWYAGGTEAVRLCRRLLPYLKIKHRQAEIVLALSDLGYTRGGKAPRWVSDETLAARVPLIAEIRALNHRGLPQKPSV
jgi:hypothetical protein